MFDTIRKYLHHAIRAASALITGFIAFVVLVQVPSFVERDGGVVSITSPLPLLIPLALAAGVYLLLEKPLNKSRHFYNPDLFKSQAQTYAEIFSNNYAEALRANSVASFLDAWGCAYVAHGWLQGISFKAPAQYRGLANWQKEQLVNFQWKLRDAIERAANNTLYDLNHAHRNNKAQRMEVFIADIKGGLSRYSTETRDFAGEKLRMVSLKCGLQLSDELNALFPNSEVDNPSVEPMGLLDIDTMEGHDFEYWCASLLEKLGYIDVQVTRGSGDQGVDVLAKKDGIRYAIQCKRYTSDLGNTPVQEVNAGKTIYHCHVGAVMTNRYFTKGAKEAADATGVLLWDRDWITNAIEITD